tara:strand:- start:932 stop:1432 length:501 start_codon:yes stop_codon:yes gene_type:complete
MNSKAFTLLPLIAAGALLTGCQSISETPSGGAFSSDHAFLSAHTDAILLKKGDAAISVAPAYQGRVMTSTYDRRSGPSFGWINRPVIERGFLSDEEAQGKLEQHIYIFGGEERFWLGPEGGQFALYFKPGAKFEFSDWKHLLRSTPMRLSSSRRLQIVRFLAMSAS